MVARADGRVYRQGSYLQLATGPRASGDFESAWPIPPNPSLVGADLFHQFLDANVDAASILRLRSSNGLKLRVGVL